MRNSLFLTLSVAAAVLLAGCSPSSAPDSDQSSAPASQSDRSAESNADSSDPNDQGADPNSEPTESTPREGEPPAAPPAPAPPAAEKFTAGAPYGQCLTKNLAVSITEQGSSSGKLHYAVTFTNTGTKECLLEGFPRVQAKAGGTLIGAAASEDSSATPRSLRLTKGGTTSADLTVTNIVPGGGPLGDACTVGQGDAFAVTPPHSLIAISVPMGKIPVCSNGTSWMKVGPVINHGTT